MGSGDWNDGMNRVGHEGRGESVWLGWFLHAVLAGFAPIAEARGDTPRAERWRAQHEAPPARRSSATAGTATGTAAPSSTTARRSARPTTPSAGSIRSPSRGACCPAPPIRPRAARAMAAVDEYLVRRGDGLVLLFTPPFDRRRRSIPGYIKGYLPGIRENGGQYTHGGDLVGPRVRGARRRRQGGRAVLDAQPDQPRQHPRRRPALQGRAVRHGRRRLLPSRRTSGAAAGPGTRARPAGCTRPGSARSWGSPLHGATLVLDPCIPRAWPRYEIDFAYHSARYEIVVENPHGVSRGVAVAELDGEPVAGPGASIPLVDDGATHRIRVVLG